MLDCSQLLRCAQPMSLAKDGSDITNPRVVADSRDELGEGRGVRQRTLMRKLLASGVACALVLAVAACGGDEGSTEVGVVLDEWSVTSSVAGVREGKVSFEVRNDGTMSHQLLVIKNDLPPVQLPVANGSIALSQVNVVRSVEAVAAGSAAELSFDATPGKYVLVCNVPGHYQQGMASAFLVEP